MITSMVFAFMGGLGLFLYGMKIMSEGLQKAAGDRLRRILEKLTSNRVVALLVGAMVTAVIQSSSATTVMVVGFVNAGLMNLMQAIGVVLGANIGTTVTAQMIAFKIQKYALPAIGMGVGMKLFARRRKTQYLGEIFLGFGLLFYGLETMKHGLAALKSLPAFAHAFVTFGTNPVLAVLAGALLTMVLQSSSATVGITMALAAGGMLSFSGGLGLVLGENIGTTITALLASIGTNVTARRAARAHLLFNVLGVCYVLLLFPFFAELVDHFTPGDPEMVVETTAQAVQLGVAVGDKPYISRHLANAHTLFNVFNCLLFLPLIGLLAKVSSWMVPGREGEGDYHLSYLDNLLLDTPALAMSEVRQETVRMARVVMEMFHQTVGCLEAFTPAVSDDILRKENTVDMLQKEITNFVVTLTQSSLTPEISRETTSVMYIVNNLERLGDHSENLLRLIDRKVEKKIEFSREALDEIHEIAARCGEFIALVAAGYEHGNEKIIVEAKRLEGSINTLEDRYRKRHIRRLNEGGCTVVAGLIFIDMLTNFEKIGDHCYNIAEVIGGVK
ncbi:MAG: Na/Pi cotransporter family protein [Deltaproteobacteria bacterium]|nr:Na/Pi cotransporter family protein [Candidatus Anaeroferrophillacea bacterium]